MHLAALFISLLSWSSAMSCEHASFSCLACGL
jgi:hypothetical protein